MVLITTDWDRSLLVCKRIKSITTNYITPNTDCIKNKEKIEIWSRRRDPKMVDLLVDSGYNSRQTIKEEIKQSIHTVTGAYSMIWTHIHIISGHPKTVGPNRTLLYRLFLDG